MTQLLTRQPRHGTSGFSLIEMLFVLSIIALLGALMFPALASARAKARATSCTGNLHQIGAAIAMYAQDYDDQYPFGLDPVDKFTDIWKGDAAFKATLTAAPMLSEVTLPYTKNRQIWRCPSDIGFDSLEHEFDDQGDPVLLGARPTCFEKYGTSYFYRTSLVLDHKSYGSFTGRHMFKGGEVFQASEINVVSDANGSWHGGFGQRRYNCLMGDGHVQSVGSTAFDTLKKIIVD